MRVRHALLYSRPYGFCVAFRKCFGLSGACVFALHILNIAFVRVCVHACVRCLRSPSRSSTAYILFSHMRVQTKHTANRGGSGGGTQNNYACKTANVYVHVPDATPIFYARVFRTQTRVRSRLRTGKCTIGLACPFAPIVSPNVLAQYLLWFSYECARVRFAGRLGPVQMMMMGGMRLECNKIR